jgi:hypothetical protein
VAPVKPQAPRPGSAAQLPKVVAREESASPPAGEPLYRGAPSPRVQSDEGASARSMGDDPVAVLRAELEERDAMIGRLLASVDRRLRTQESLRPPPKVEAEEPPLPSPSAWKAALFKLVVGLGAILTAAATYLGVKTQTTLPPKVEANEVRTTVTKTDAAATDIASLRGRVSLLERRLDDGDAYWIEVWRVNGVQVRRPDGLPAAPKIDVVMPHRGSSGPIQVNTPPPK